ncbi:MAG: hypothetical protein MZV63_56350 [Marinilabiliales bacterium]|nr:hypothetical protein [Marinilabiliales bacterium]
MPALEQTTAEIIEGLSGTCRGHPAGHLWTDWASPVKLADLVKFAKAQPLCERRHEDEPGRWRCSSSRRRSRIDTGTEPETEVSRAERCDVCGNPAFPASCCCSIPVLVCLVLYTGGKRHQPTCRSVSTQASHVSALKPEDCVIHHGICCSRSAMAELALLIIALARPQTSLSAAGYHDRRHRHRHRPRHLAAACWRWISSRTGSRRPRRWRSEFIDGRPNDRIGLVIFSGEAFTQCPLTTDHARAEEPVPRHPAAE